MRAYPTIEDVTGEIYRYPAQVELRKEQQDAVKLAKAMFGSTPRGGIYTVAKGKKQFLWNAKMRFGKTLCALQLVKEMDVKRVLIVTHRPVVNKEWTDNFDKLFKGNPDYDYGTKSERDNYGNYADLERFVRQPGKHYIFFASMQYLRRSTLVGGDNDGNLKKKLLQTNWDLVIVDEAHEGTRTALGERVLELLNKEDTKMLHLSGTPFNLVKDFKNNEIYTWDYIKEQQAKREWAEKYPLEPNPYEILPQMNICNFNLGKVLDEFIEGGATFRFTEFFRTWTGNEKADKVKMPEGKKGRFVHEEAVKRFLDKLCEDSPNSNYPFSTDNFKESFNHTLWIVPGIREAKALKQLLLEHEVFGTFGEEGIINVAGNRDGDEEREDALERVQKAIGKQPLNTYTITISCGRLTTGVTVPEWTAVLYMKGSDLTSTSTYMQTIFRVQSPWVIKDDNGNPIKLKRNCFVFDFAPDRSLRMVADTASFSTLIEKKSEKKDDEDISENEKNKETIREFMALCPIVSIDEGAMNWLDETELFAKLESVYIDRIVLSGFDDRSLYDREEVMKMDAAFLNDLGKRIEDAVGKDGRKDSTPNDDLRLTKLTEEQRRQLEEAKRKARENARNKRDRTSGMTDEEREAYLADQENKKKEREERANRITNIRGIALRIPLLMYGGADVGDPKEDLTVDNFTQKIKQESWDEFMPKGISKKDFNAIRKCFNATRFEEAGKRYRQLAREADEMHVEDRMRRIADIFDCFHNPDKETVLTKWRVVNMHLGNALGGYCFYDPTFDEKLGRLNEPRYIDFGELTNETFGQVDYKTGTHKAHILEINSKTGLYPLYAVYSMYRALMNVYIEANAIEDPANISIQEEQAIWDEVVKNNMYVICNTPMAVRITRRTLLGFRDEAKDNIKAEKLVEKAINDQETLIKELRRVSFWKDTNSKDMIKYNAVVGNPPYMETSNVNNRQDPIYHHFYDLADALSDIYTLISPARFLFNAGLTPSAWNLKMLNDEHLKVVYYTADPTTCFPNTAINGGITIMLKNAKVKYNPIKMFLPDENLRSISSKFDPNSPNSLKTIVFGGRSDLKFNANFLRDYPNSPQDRLAFIQIKRPAVERLGPNEEYELKTSTFEALPYAFQEAVDSPSEYYHLFGLINSIRVWRYTKREYMSPRYPDNNNIEKYKVFLGEADGAAGQVGKPIPARIIGKTEIGRPGDSATSSFISVGAFDTEEEALNCAKYMKTKFLRCLVGVLKITQHIAPAVWAYVPIQDFTSSSDIKWEKSISEIDKQLYDKYDFGWDERNFIDKHIADME